VLDVDEIYGQGRTPLYYERPAPFWTKLKEYEERKWMKHPYRGQEQAMVWCLASRFHLENFRTIFFQYWRNTFLRVWIPIAVTSEIRSSMSVLQIKYKKVQLRLMRDTTINRWTRQERYQLARRMHAEAMAGTRVIPTGIGLTGVWRQSGDDMDMDMPLKDGD
jgi:hypothetical protein